MDSAPAQGERPLISVIITSYNYAHYLSESISSVLTQNVNDIELIVVDNASTDNTDEIVAAFSSDPRLHYYKNATNIGLTPRLHRFPVGRRQTLTRTPA
jgi:glycosyltransferase involved in cell wall biosynthesis